MTSLLRAPPLRHVTRHEFRGYFWDATLVAGTPLWLQFLHCVGLNSLPNLFQNLVDWICPSGVYLLRKELRIDSGRLLPLFSFLGPIRSPFFLVIAERTRQVRSKARMATSRPGRDECRRHHQRRLRARRESRVPAAARNLRSISRSGERRSQEPPQSKTLPGSRGESLCSVVER